MLIVLPDFVHIAVQTKQTPICSAPQEFSNEDVDTIPAAVYRWVCGDKPSSKGRASRFWKSDDVEHLKMTGDESTKLNLADIALLYVAASLHCLLGIRHDGSGHDDWHRVAWRDDFLE